MKFKSIMNHSLKISLMALVAMFAFNTTADAQFGGLLKKAKQAVSSKPKESAFDKRKREEREKKEAEWEAEVKKEYEVRNWKTGEMKPLNDYAPGGYQPPFKSYGTVTQSDFADARNNIIIGYEITDGLFMNLSSHFSWDGGTHKFAGSDIQLPKQQKILPKNVNAKDLKYYAFYDIDDDGNSEIFLSNKDHSIEISAVIRSYEKAEKELLTRRDGSEFKFYKGGIAVTGSCGSGCSAADYVLVKNT